MPSMSTFRVVVTETVFPATDKLDELGDSDELVEEVPLVVLVSWSLPSPPPPPAFSSTSAAAGNRAAVNPIGRMVRGNTIAKLASTVTRVSSEPRKRNKANGAASSILGRPLSRSVGTSSVENKTRSPVGGKITAADGFDEVV